jgi:hypothetical protein
MRLYIRGTGISNLGVMGIVGGWPGNLVGLALPYIVMRLTSQGGQRSVLLHL